MQRTGKHRREQARIQWLHRNRSRHRQWLQGGWLTLLLVIPVMVLAADYFEFRDGELSDDPAMPTVIALDPGANRIGGQVRDLPLDPDFFTVQVPADHELTAVTLSEFRLISSPRDGGALVALEAGGQISNINSSDALRGFVIAGVDPGTELGDDLLDDLGGGTLAAGDWTFWVQNTGSATEYELTLTVAAAAGPPVTPPDGGPLSTVPVPTLGPGGLAALIASLLLLGLFRFGRH